MTQAPAVGEEFAQDRQEGVEVRDADLPEAEDNGARVAARPMELLLDTEVRITARLGETQMVARDVLELGPGAVVTLDRVAGEPVDLILNGECFATGNLVVVGDRLGVRIREILSLPAETAAED